MPEIIGPVVGIIRLGTDMGLNFRTNLPGNLEYPRIGNNQGVRADFLQFFKIRFHPVQISVMGQNIGRHENPGTMGMGEFNAFLHILHGKIF